MHRSAYHWALLVWPLMLAVCFWLFPRLVDSSSSPAAPSSSATVDLAADGCKLTLLTNAAQDPGLKVSALLAGRAVPVMGRVEQEPGRLVFVPALPLLHGQRYQAEWLPQGGGIRRVEFEMKALPGRRPVVSLLPRARLPANALKIYLSFSEPMEQGVFLDRLKLLDAQGRDISGPFRETELWSPDGRRLTVWFHPGRQKTGVNLNEDEGPVLKADSRCTLVVDGRWRSTSGAALGEDVRFEFETGPADHQMPGMSRWNLTLPGAGSLEPLVVRFDEPLDPAMLMQALRVQQKGLQVEVRVMVPASGEEWRAVPMTAWQAGALELLADPLLEDLAGNSLTRLFEEEEGVVRAVPSLRRSLETR
jgi:hypothetical protein